MASLYHLLLLSFLLRLSAAAAAASPDSIGQYCDKSSTSSQIKSSINTVLSDLVAKASIGGFATSSSGKASNTIYGLAQCRGDVSSDDCSACLTAAAQKLPTICPSDADARIWYDFCFVRYDNENFIGKADTGYALILINVENATEPEKFDKEVGPLMRKVSAQAAQPGSGGLGRGTKVFTPYVTIYGLAQCTRDLQPLACSQCLSAAVENMPEYCRYRKGCQVHYSSCTARYEIYPFFFPLGSTKAKIAASAESNYIKKTILHP